MARSAVDPSRNGVAAQLDDREWQTMRTGAPVVTAPRRRRSRGLIALGVALMATCGAGAVTVFNSSSDLQPAVGVAAEVPFGSMITEGDLVQIQVHPDPAVHAVAWDQRAQLVGQRAATDLLPGSVITGEAVGRASIPAPGQSLVGVAVKTGQLPATPLNPRDKVLLVPTESAVGGDPGAGGSTIGGTVVVVGDVDGSGVRVVDIEVPGGEAGQLAAQASAGRIAIVLQPRG